MTALAQLSLFLVAIFAAWLIVCWVMEFVLRFPRWRADRQQRLSRRESREFVRVQRRVKEKLIAETMKGSGE